MKVITGDKQPHGGMCSIQTQLNSYLDEGTFSVIIFIIVMLCLLLSAVVQLFLVFALNNHCAFNAGVKLLLMSGNY